MLSSHTGSIACHATTSASLIDLGMQNSPYSMIHYGPRGLSVSPTSQTPTLQELLQVLCLASPWVIWPLASARTVPGYRGDRHKSEGGSFSRHMTGQDATL